MTEIPRETLESARDGIVRLFTGDYSRNGGAPLFAVRARTGEAPPFHSMDAELADWAPFLWMANDAGRGYAEAQAERLAKRLVSGAEILTPYRGWKGWVFPARANSFHGTDLVLGLLDLHALGSCHATLDLARAVFAGIVERYEEGGWICQWRLPGLGVRIPVAETTAALWIELALELGEGEKARAWGRTLLSDPFFARTGLFPEHVVVRKSPWSRFVRAETDAVRLAKHNLAAGASLLALARAEPAGPWKGALSRWHEAVRAYFLRPEGGASAVLRFGPDGTVARRSLPHIKNHGLADLCCDAAHFLKEGAFLETARSLSGFWLSRQSAATGLLPYEPEGPRAGVSFLDGETDWAIALLKLHELTEEGRYREAALRILAGVLSRHRSDRGYVNGVDLATGEIRDDLVETRYGALLLKPILFLLSGKRIYDPADPFWWKMLLDR